MKCCSGCGDEQRRTSVDVCWGVLDRLANKLRLLTNGRNIDRELRAGGRRDLHEASRTHRNAATITVWTNSDHCFMWIRVPSPLRPEGGPDIDYAFEASHTGATTPSLHGVGLRPRTQYYANSSSEGFIAHHWPGT
jgi:hypothetical protein